MVEKRVLIVDDDDTIRRLLTVICRKHGYPYDEAKDGFEALELLREKEYGVVLPRTQSVSPPQVSSFTESSANRSI